MLHGVPLDQLGLEGINNNDALSLTVLAAATFTPELPPSDTNPAGHRPRAHSLNSAPILPKAIFIGCGGGVAFGHWMAFLNSQVSPTTTGEHWNAPARTTNYMATNALLKRKCPGDPEYGYGVKSLKPEVVIGNISRRTNELEEGQQGTAGAATTIVHTFISSQVHLLVLESTPYLLKSAT